MKSNTIRCLAFVLAIFVLTPLHGKNAFCDDQRLVSISPVDDGEMTDDDYVPQTISRQETYRTTARPLPSADKTPRGYNQVGYEMPPAPPRGTVIPRNFLEDDESETTVPRPIPSPRKTPRPLVDVDEDSDEILYEDDIVLPGSHRRFLVADSNGTPPNAVLNVDDTEFNGVYAECSPSPYEYTAYPIIKPFGTGIVDNLTFFGGATAFRNELDPPEKGNFGFTTGFNWAGSVIPQYSVSAQVGFRATLSNLCGRFSYDDNAYRKSIREQYFVTTGLFKRDLGSALQAGVAYDWCFDEFYDKITLQQLRTEVSLRTFSHLEYGFQGAFGMSKEKGDWISRLMNNPAAYYQAQNCFFLFGRKHWENGGLAELRFGATDHGDILVGGLGEFPINDCLTLNGGFSLLCPKEGGNREGWRRETWEVSVGVVFYFRGGACSKPCNPCRPMFDVAGNGSFFGRLFR